jgi:hypothetical protein
MREQRWRLRVVRSVRRSPLDPMEQRPARQLRTEARARRLDDVRAGIDARGPVKEARSSYE